MPTWFQSWRYIDREREYKMSKDQPVGYFIELINEHLGENENIQQMLRYLTKYPEIYDIYCAELESALSLFSKLQCNPHEFPGESDILINARYLQQILNGDKLLSRTELEGDIKKWRDEKKLWELIFSELSGFEFVNQEIEPNIFSGEFFVAFYRTCTLIKYPYIREKNGQVASSVEEMLAVFAIAGCQTQLYLSTRHWLLDYQNEGFSPLLSKRLEDIPYAK